MRRAFQYRTQQENKIYEEVARTHALIYYFLSLLKLIILTIFYGHLIYFDI